GVTVFVLFLLSLILNQRRKRKKLTEQIKNGYGRVPTRNYTEEELKKIESYYRKTGDGSRFTIDDITWNDLDMDTLYGFINTCLSSIGDEVLYKILREPLLEPEKLNRRRELIRFFETHEKEREAVSLIYARIGRTKKFSLAEFLDSFRDVREVNPIRFLLPLALLIAAIALFFFNVTWGILGVVFVMILNISTYFRLKGQIEPWYVSMSAMAYLAGGGLELAKLSVPELEPEISVIREDAGRLKSLKRRMRWLGAAGQGLLSLSVAEILMDYVRMITHLDFFMFYRMLKTIRTEENTVRRLMESMGSLEAMISIASYRQTLPYFTEGDFRTEGAVRVSFTDGYHPLIDDPVANGIENVGHLLLTGSNASGKSTFLRMSALLVLLGETIATIPASSFSSPYLRVYTSMALKDNLIGGESYFIVEIKSIKRIMDAFDNATPVFACIDEVLRGTNTVERVAASTELLNDFAGRNGIVFAATHDIELTKLLTSYRQCHFEEFVTDNDVKFDYQLKEGPAKSRNAIRLLNLMGYDREVTDKAEAMAESFLENGTWKLS
ncbi:MAG: hypothetical protein IK088_07355, partial [Lachnospiraceae bacterium]|nr:hypothetical protein [Lachnospiraceae bacterium]